MKTVVLYSKPEICALYLSVLYIFISDTTEQQNNNNAMGPSVKHMSAEN